MEVGNQLYETFRPMFLSEQYSDLTIMCGDREFKAHRLVVCGQSTFFTAACRGQFQEAISGIINLPQDDPEIFHKFLEFLYKGTYEDGEYPNNGPDPVALTSAKEIKARLDREHGTVKDGIGATTDEEERPFALGLNIDEELSDSDSSYMPQSPSSPSSNMRNTSRDGEPHTIGRDSYARSVADLEGDANENIDLLDDSELEDLPVNREEIAREVKELGEELKEKDPDAHSSKSVALTKIPYSHSLHTSVELYIMADKFDVPALRLLSLERLYRTAQVCLLKLPDLDEVVDQIYSMTGEKDEGIREIPARLIGAEYPFDSKLREKMQPVMLKHGEFCLRTLHYSMYSATKAGLGPHPVMTFPRRDRRKNRSLRTLGKQKTRGGNYKVSKGGKVLHDS